MRMEIIATFLTPETDLERGDVPSKTVRTWPHFLLLDRRPFSPLIHVQKLVSTISLEEESLPAYKKQTLPLPNLKTWSITHTCPIDHGYGTLGVELLSQLSSYPVRLYEEVSYWQKIAAAQSLRNQKTYKQYS